MENTTESYNQIPEMTLDGAFKSSRISLAAFLLMFLTFPLLKQYPGIIYLSTIFAVIFHIALLPMIECMPAPAWTKIGGFAWVVVDIVLAIAGLNGIPNSTIEPLRFGVHVMLVIWPIGIAMANDGLIRWASILFTITTGLIPFFGTLIPPTAKFVGMPFMLLWFVAMILKLRQLSSKKY